MRFPEANTSWPCQATLSPLRVRRLKKDNWQDEVRGRVLTLNKGGKVMEITTVVTGVGGAHAFKALIHNHRKVSFWIV